MKLFLDFLPIIAFVAAYFMTDDIYYATAWLIVGSALLVTGNWLIFRKVDKMHLFTFILLLIFGGATLFFRQPLLIQWKPTIATWVLALVCFGSKYIGKAPLMERLMGSKIELPREVWLSVTNMWAIFFLFSGAANLFVFTQYSESSWVAFKLYGQLSFTLLFLIFQAIYLSRHIGSTGQTKKN
ncbi:MAG: septation protein IspZ [Candidatus Portiera sp.]|nr:septation protein IspZ [Portiera sp.]